jgi:hypothetical protein
MTKKANGTKQKNDLCRNKAQFIKLYPQYGSIGETLKAIGIKRRRTFYDWCESDPKFKEIYETELLPARRDTLVSRLYQCAMGKLKLQREQLTAIYGFLKATDHMADQYDNIIFTEKHQHELVGEGGGPIQQETKIVFDSDSIREAFKILADAGVIRVAEPDQGGAGVE